MQAKTDTGARVISLCAYRMSVADDTDPAKERARELRRLRRAYGVSRKATSRLRDDLNSTVKEYEASRKAQDELFREIVDLENHKPEDGNETTRLGPTGTG